MMRRSKRKHVENSGFGPYRVRHARKGLSVLLAGLMLITVLNSAASDVAPEWTEAAWTDSDNAEGAFNAITVPVPEGVDCAYNPGLLGVLLPSVTLQWKVPGGSPLPAPYTFEPGFQTAGFVSSLLDGLLASVTTTSSGGVYTTKATALLATNLFGSARNLGVRVRHPSGWTSTWLVGVATSQALGTSGSCTFVTRAG